ncbi:MAG: YhdH/YhfP family quinone oxidoreductase [Spirosomataceae bacterium]|jgi:alcohol dehydrogenase
MNQYRHFEVTEKPDGSFETHISISEISDLPQNELLVKVHFSSLNYKDALSASGNKGITKAYPHTPGIDAAGVVVKSDSEKFNIGDEVIVTSYDLGMNTRGGFSEYISVPARWAIPKPAGLSLRESMILGTAGLTAAMALDKILNNSPQIQKIAVTGASGGVGLWALLLIKHLGLETVAISRKVESNSIFEEIGTHEIINNFEISNRPIAKPIFDAAIDTVGGDILSQLLKSVKPNGSVAACGMAASSDFSSSVFPFILRGINLLGIDSAEAEYNWRVKLWNLLANDWKVSFPENLVHETGLRQLPEYIKKMLNGEHFGRTILNLSLD